jgi:HSP20 family molecular chaperone IbpA
MKVENGDLLVVRSNKKDENNKVLYRLQLTKDIDHKNIKAKSQDGVLRLTLPALTEKKSKCITIE